VSNEEDREETPSLEDWSGRLCRIWIARHLEKGLREKPRSDFGVPVSAEASSYSVVV
jgi:hypothetical protein